MIKNEIKVKKFEKLRLSNGIDKSAYFAIMVYRSAVAYTESYIFKIG